MVSSDRVCKYLRCIRPSRDTPISTRRECPCCAYLPLTFHLPFNNIATLPPFISSAPISLPVNGSGSDTDEIVFTTDPVLNFLQLAVRTCQRAQADRNKQVREVWIRLCGTYQSKGGLLARPEVRSALNELSTLFFAIPPPRGQAGNALGDMLSSMFGGAPSAGGGPRVLSPSVQPAAGLD